MPATPTSAHVLTEAFPVSQVFAQIKELGMRRVSLSHRLRPVQEGLTPGIACMGGLPKHVPEGRRRNTHP